MAHITKIFGMTRDDLVSVWGNVEMSQKQFELFGEELDEMDSLWDTIIDMLKDEYLNMQEQGRLEESEDEEEEEEDEKPPTYVDSIMASVMEYDAEGHSEWTSDEEEE